jgi:hypothetical protein
MIRSLPPSSFYLKWRCPAEQNPQSHRRRRLYRVRRIWRWTREASTAPFFPLNWRSRNRLKPLEVQSFLSSTGVHQKTAWIAHLGPSIALHLVKLRYVVIIGLICPWSVVMPMIHAVTKPCQVLFPFLAWYGNPLLCIIAWSQQLAGISQRDATTFYPVLLEKNSDRQLLLGFL